MRKLKNNIVGTKRGARMSRLTEKFSHNGFEYMATGLGSNNPYAIDKLGKLEDLEEELGFSLEKLNETTHIYATDWENVLRKHEIIGVNFKEKKIWFWDTFSPMYLEFEYYKKSFWLKEDKSE